MRFLKSVTWVTRVSTLCSVLWDRLISPTWKVECRFRSSIQASLKNLIRKSNLPTQQTTFFCVISKLMVPPSLFSPPFEKNIFLLLERSIRPCSKIRLGLLSMWSLVQEKTCGAGGKFVTPKTYNNYTLFVAFYLFICLIDCLSVCLSVYPLYLSVGSLSVRPPIHSSDCWPADLSGCLSVSMHIYLSICSFVHLSVHVPACLCDR